MLALRTQLPSRKDDRVCRRFRGACFFAKPDLSVPVAFLKISYARSIVRTGRWLSLILDCQASNAAGDNQLKAYLHYSPSLLIFRAQGTLNPCLARPAALIPNSLCLSNRRRLHPTGASLTCLHHESPRFHPSKHN